VRAGREEPVGSELGRGRDTVPSGVPVVGEPSVQSVTSHNQAGR
jgi:hypothetical protein